MFWERPRMKMKSVTVVFHSCLARRPGEGWHGCGLGSQQLNIDVWIILIHQTCLENYIDTPLSLCHENAKSVSSPSGRQFHATRSLLAEWTLWNCPQSHSPGTVADLKRAAQESFGQSFLRLAAPDGRLLAPTMPLPLSGLQNGDSLTAVALQPKITATRSAFALWCEGGDRIITWGHPDFGGGTALESQDQLRNVQQISGTFGAFAALLAEGTVVTWGHPKYGGDSSRVQAQLRNVKQICGTASAFAAILEDLTVVTWGSRGTWWWLLQSPTSAEECSADLWHSQCLCCRFGRWKCSDMGSSRPWWWQLQSPRSAKKCSADLCHRLCFCCHFGRWNCSDVGGSRLWWWQLQSPKPAAECSEDLWHKHCLCCHFGRWKCGDMGPSTIWWWQL